MSPDLYLAPEHPDHTAQVEALNARLYGPDRHKKTVARYRTNATPIKPLCLVALKKSDNTIAGSISYWPVTAGGVDFLMLGPVSVDPAFQGSGAGTALIETSLKLAEKAGFGGVFLKCADASLFPYYEKFGFSRAAAANLRLPGAKSAEESALLMARDLIPGTMAHAHGEIKKFEPLTVISPVMASEALFSRPMRQPRRRLGPQHVLQSA